MGAGHDHPGGGHKKGTGMHLRGRADDRPSRLPGCAPRTTKAPAEGMAGAFCVITRTFTTRTLMRWCRH
jgi:hypothetical protein